MRLTFRHDVCVELEVLAIDEMLREVFQLVFIRRCVDRAQGESAEQWQFIIGREVFATHQLSKLTNEHVD